ncbi:probable mediator of RNA polymerase II transcription subunit 26c isoform X3 [Solanum dulcamara]|uniref:probable mediator of RNA polymerase II transcription subunit 26c isoform X3 n=1 Tax=Solanum dulcamara TaxID=45834 RepID=UPI002485B03C|nr:probable mediator of RNA polymerase II transcription subunit 26c isoform X3 [Solanum dulcamara]
MELDELRLILKNSGVDLWGLIDTAISVAILDHGNELRSRRDAIVERLYTPLLCNNSYSAEIPKSIERNIDDDHKLKTEEKSTVDYEEDLEISKIITIKNHFEISNQSENCLVDLLQCLAEMDISFKVLEKTDIGRHVNRLRKHSSNEVRRLVKLLIRRWKDIVDEWVRLNTSMEETDDFEDGAYISNDSPLYCGHKPKQKGEEKWSLKT